MRDRFSELINQALEAIFGLRIQPASESRLSRIRSEVLKNYQCDMILDVGANLGQWALRVRKNGFQGQIISYEPSQVFKKLAENAKQDQLWTVKNVALADFVGTSPYFVASNEGLSSSMLKPKEILNHDLAIDFRVEIEVPVTTLDSEELESKNIYLKIDAQGSEYAVLNGAKKLIKDVMAVEFESSLVELYENEKNHYVISNYLMNCGFEPAQVVITHWDINLRTISIDAIFVRKSSFT